ncbi:acyl-CoA dehydrogenase [Cupriavidus necator]|uniref:Acyl-CoA dehydrogenase n=1 Tax=Cupriavidus necator TaxID=106590 RepID=A0A1U9UPY4_CUPNE|nr:acyl-CoA dehydrogenase family protein [Cupriavidus necator]AQV94698.1 acyl-CoA dehydrogenase [Cupriavidus necator]
MTPKLHQFPWMDADIELFRSQLRRFVEAEMVPRLPTWREQGFIDRDIWRQMGELGMMLPEIPEEYGGSGASMAYQAVVIDELARAEMPMKHSVHSIVAHYLLEYGTEDQRRRWLPKLASGEWITAIAMTEPGCGSDLKTLRTSAVRDGDHYVLNGAKTFITNGSTAQLVLVACKTDPAAGAKGVSLIALEVDGEVEGFRVGRVLDKIGQKSADTCELFFDNVRVPAANLIGGVEGQGFIQMMSQLPWERLIVAVAAAAVIEQALEQTVAYTRERKMFGHTTFDFQNTRFKLAECATTAHILRGFVNDCIQRLLDGTLDPEAAYMAKWWASEQQGKVLDECLQCFGGYGYMNEYPIARMYTDARIQRIYGGTNELMKELIARKL